MNVSDCCDVRASVHRDLPPASRPVAHEAGLGSAAVLQHRLLPRPR